MRAFFLLLLASSVLVSCKKDEKPAAQTGAQVAVEIEHLWENTIPFALGTEYTLSSTSEQLNFYTMKYYVSNIRLQRKDGTWWTEQESYHLVDVSKGTATGLAIKNVPSGEYVGIEMLFGVDSTRNVSGAQTGALAVSNGMFWTWNTGYIFIKAEGTSPQVQNPSGAFTFHLAGFSGSNNISIRKAYTFSGETLTVASGKQPKIGLKCSISALWENAAPVEVSNNIQETGQVAKAMAKPFYTSFQFDHIHN